MSHYKAAPLFLVIFFIFIEGCSLNTKKVQTTVLHFTEKEQGTEIYPVRMLVTDRFLRMDDGDDSGDFLLFDRKKKIIYNTNHSDRNILVINEQKVSIKPPYELNHSAVTGKSELPKIDGESVIEYKLSTNDKQCYHLHVVNGILGNAIKALKEYRLALAGEQAQVLANIPVSMQTPCDLANNIFKPARHLDNGFPIRLQDMNGRLRELVDYKSELVDVKLFVLPDGYGSYSTGSTR